MSGVWLRKIRVAGQGGDWPVGQVSEALRRGVSRRKEYQGSDWRRADEIQDQE